MLISFGVGNVFAQSHFAIVTGKVNSLKDKDSVLLTINKLGDPFFEENTNYKVVIKNKTYFFKIRVDEFPTHFYLKFIENKNDVKVSNKLNSLALNSYYI